MLAILDHNENTGRGIVRKEVKYSKPTKKYVECFIRSPKCYMWRKELVDKVCSFVGGNIDTQSYQSVFPARPTNSRLIFLFLLGNSSLSLLRGSNRYGCMFDMIIVTSAIKQFHFLMPKLEWVSLHVHACSL